MSSKPKTVRQTLESIPKEENNNKLKKHKNDDL